MKTRLCFCDRSNYYCRQIGMLGMSKFKTTLKGDASSHALKICNSLIKLVKEDFSDALPRDKGARPPTPSRSCLR